MERREFWRYVRGWFMVGVYVFFVSFILVIFTPQPREDFQPSNCTRLCPSSENCTASENGTVTCNTTDGSDSVFSGSVSSTFRYRRAVWVLWSISCFLFLCSNVSWCISCQYSGMVMKDQENDLSPNDIIVERMELSSNFIGGEYSCATDQLKATALDDEKHSVGCHAADDLETIVQFGSSARHLGSIEQRHQVDFGQPMPGNTAHPKRETQCYSEFGPGQNLHRSRPRRVAWQPLTEPPQSFRTHRQVQSTPVSDTAVDDIAKHTTAVGSLAIVPDGEAVLSRRHGPTESSLHIATHNTAIPPVVSPRPFPTRTERSILFTPEIVVVPDEIMTSSNASKLFRRCARLHDHLESLMELDIISPQLCCQVTAECQSHGNMSGLALLYRQVKQVGNEVRFLTELRAHREEMANCTSSIGSDEAGGAASRLSETASPCSSATSLDSASAISLLRGHEMLMWVQALDKLEDLICEGILTVYQYAYIVDLVRHDWQISALMQIVNGCHKQARLQRFLATPPTTTTPPRRGSPHGAATAAGAGRSTQQ